MPVSDTRSPQLPVISGPVIEWLLNSDPSIRWQTMSYLTEASAAEVASERAKVASDGWGRQLLDMQQPDGTWSGVAWNHGWNSTMHVLMLLRDFGVLRENERVRLAVQSVRDRVKWVGEPGWDGNAFFDGEVEPCINGQVAAVGAYFGLDVRSIIDRLLGEQLADGGWNCEAPFGSARSSFNTTICVLEALLEFERSIGGNSEVAAARVRGQEYLLERHLFRCRSTGAIVERDRKGGTSWRQFAFPTWWHYDVLRGLEYLCKARVTPDERVSEAIELVLSKRTPEGRWPSDIRYSGPMPVDFGEHVGEPSRWITLRALRVLKWSGR